MGKFEMQKRLAMEDLKKARKRGEADRDDLRLLDLINGYDDLYTTSSCLGRICVLETTKEHDKLNSRWLGKWHRTVRKSDIIKALKKNKRGVAYMQNECPILHIVARDLGAAKSLLNIALESGFKRSGIHGLNDDRVVIEVCSTETLEAPLAVDGKRLTDDKYIESLVEIANIRWLKGQDKLKKFRKMLKVRYS